MLEDKPIKIKVRNLSKVFGSQPKKALELRNQGLNRPEILEQNDQTLGLSNINFDVYDGELLVIMGLSGSGKSTLIRCLNRLIEPTEGQIFIDDKEKRQRITTEVLEQVGLGEWADAHPHQLSGGMQQRVGIARALANDGAVLLMDEAFSALDPLIRKDMQQELQELQYRTKKTTIFITHDLDEALNIGDRIILLKDGEIVQEGTPEQILSRPADNYVARFIEGVDKARVLTASSAMRPARVTARPTDGPRTTLHKMTESGFDSLYIVGRDRQFIGLIDAGAVRRAIQDQADDLTAYLDKDVPTVSPDEPLNSLFGLFAERSIPIAVVNEEQQLLGVVIKGAVLDELAKAGEPAA